MYKLIWPVLLQLFIFVQANGASCPTDFNYVTQMKWDKSSCQSADPVKDNCCQTLLSLFGVGLAQYLKDSSNFEFPDYSSANACVNSFQSQVASASVSPALVSQCLNDTSLFVSSPNLCSGIQTKKNWLDLLGTTSIDTACKGDLLKLSSCNLCKESAQKVVSTLVGFSKNVTAQTSLKCFYFAVVYASGLVNEYGPKNETTASCTFGLPLQVAGSSNHGRLVLIYTAVGSAGVFLGICGGLAVYFLREKRNREAVHRRFIRRNRTLLKATVRPNTGAIWFKIDEIKAATDNFSRRNLIGQGGFGTVYKGTLPDGQIIAVKRIQNCSAEGDADFANEVEIINNIKHRNLLTEKSDVYSFGVVLLEIMSGRRALDTSVENASDYLVTDWAWNLVKAGKAIKVVDQEMRESGPASIMERFVLVGIMCAHVMVAFRPTIVEVLKILEGDIEIPEILDRPLPLTHQSVEYGDSSFRISVDYSAHQ
ncbi:hypothetical protein SUGI_0477080 [Cryptomeria japonica]|nr:hypothetical protein SUGI_0477080 [Cryptomeria japonica]